MRRPVTPSQPAPARASAAVAAGPRFPVWLMAALLALVTMALYWPATGHDFINYDDPDYVTANPQVQSGLTWAGVKWAFLNPVCWNWHPLTVLSHMLVCQLVGLNPWGHHLTNVLLHALNAALVFGLLQQMTGARWRSLLVAALFALHPLRVESVAWVAERKDVLSGCFGLLCLWAYVRYVEKSKVQGLKSEAQNPKSEGNPKTEVRSPKPDAESTGRSAVPSSRFEGQRSRLEVRPSPSSLFALRRFWYWAAVVLFALGLMSKPMLVTLPFVLLLLDYWPLQRYQPALCNLKPPARKFHPSSFILHPLLLEKLPFFALAAAASVVTFVVQQRGGSLIAAENLPLSARGGNALVSYCRYLGKLFWPTDLAVFYPHPGQWPLAKVVLAGGLILGLSGLLFAQRWRFPFLLTGWLWFVGMLVPMIGLVQTGGQAMADRHTYIPSLGMLILAVWGAYELARRWRYCVMALSAGVSVAMLLCVAVTRQQLGYWQDSESLFRHALEVTENNDLAHNNLGNALARKDQTGEAIRQYQEALRLNPACADTHNNLGNALVKKGQIDEAVRQFQEALRLKPDDAPAHYNLGNALVEKGQMDEAIRQYQEALRLKPDDAEAHYNLGVALEKKGQTDEAIRQYQEALRLKPDYAEAHNNLGNALGRKGHTDEAIRHFQQAIRLKPDYAFACNNLGAALGVKGQVDEAIRQFQEAIRLKPDYAEARNNLARALEMKSAPEGR